MIRGMKLFAILALLASCAFAQTNLNAAGATFPYPIYSKWFNEYHKEHPDIEINYQAIGSGGGIRQLLAGTVDFGASDGPMTDAQLAEAKFKIYHIPTVLGAVIPAYNVPGVSAPVKFSPEVIAGICLGKITNWNNKAIAQDNLGIKFPDMPIVVVHRSDGSGTNYIFTDYLSKVSPEWKGKVGKGTSVNWPVGLGAKGNEGVSGMIRQMEGGFGYVELIYAIQNNIPYGEVRNAAGGLVIDTRKSAGILFTEAAAAVVLSRLAFSHAPGKERIPNCQLYLAFNSRAVQRREQGQGPGWIPELDVGSGRVHGQSAWVRSPARQCRGKGPVNNQADTLSSMF